MRVIAGFLSPSHDSYLRSKLQSRYDADSMNAAHRLQMLRLAIKDSGCNDWLYADEWESGQPGFIDYPDVVAHFETAIRDMGFETTLSGKVNKYSSYMFDIAAAYLIQHLITTMCLFYLLFFHIYCAML